MIDMIYVIYICTPIYTQVHMFVYMSKKIPAHTRSKSTRVDIYTHKYIYTYIYRYTYAYIYRSIYIYTAVDIYLWTPPILEAGRNNLKQFENHRKQQVIIKILWL